MTLIDDMATAIENYPQTDVTISITDVAIQSGAGPSINVNEVWKFKAEVENNGHMDMTNVSLHVSGVNGVLVSTNPAGPFEATITTGNLSISGGGSSAKTAYLYFKPTAVKPAGTNLVTAHIADWLANFDHFFNNHTRHAATPLGAHDGQVFPA